MRKMDPRGQDIVKPGRLSIHGTGKEQVKLIGNENMDVSVLLGVVHKEAESSPERPTLGPTSTPHPELKVDMLEGDQFSVKDFNEVGSSHRNASMTTGKKRADSFLSAALEVLLQDGKMSEGQFPILRKCLLNKTW